MPLSRKLTQLPAAVQEPLNGEPMQQGMAFMPLWWAPSSFCDADDGNLTRAEKAALTRKRNQIAQVMDDLASEPTGKYNDMWRCIELTILPFC